MKSHPKHMLETHHGKGVADMFGSKNGECAYTRHDASDDQLVNYFTMQRNQGGFILGPASSRTAAELHLHFNRWYISGGFTFEIGPETSAIIQERIAKDDIPCAPVPPAYLRFPEPIVEYAEGCSLRAAYISRGVVGRITFLDDEGINGNKSQTVLLPSVFRKQHIEILASSLRMEKPEDIDEDIMAMARDMLAHKNDGDLSGLDGLIDAMASNLMSMKDIVGSYTDEGKNKDAPARIDISAIGIEKGVGPLRGEPGPGLVHATKIVLVAADEARKRNKAYGTPKYLDKDMSQRNWTEDRTSPITRQKHTIQLP